MEPNVRRRAPGPERSWVRAQVPRQAEAKIVCAEVGVKCARWKAGDFRERGACGRVDRCGLRRGGSAVASGKAWWMVASELARARRRRQGWMPARCWVQAKERREARG